MRKTFQRNKIQFEYQHYNIHSFRMEKIYSKHVAVAKALRVRLFILGPDVAFLQHIYLFLQLKGSHASILKKEGSLRVYQSQSGRGTSSTHLSLSIASKFHVFILKEMKVTAKAVQLAVLIGVVFYIHLQLSNIVLPY